MLKTVSTQLALASDTLSEILEKGNTSGPNDIVMDSGQGISFPDLSITGTGNAIYTNTTGAAFFRSSQMLFQNAAGNSGYATINSSGIAIPNGLGIDFSATPGTGTSELLDDYEEGLYTATLTPSTSGTITVSSSNDQLAYTKIGRVVYVQGFISSSGVSSPVGGAVYLNLPFAPATLSEGAGFSTGAFIFVDAPGYALTNYGCIVSPSGSRNELLIDASLVGNGDEFQIGFNYITS
jgi:hypothetical protein